VFAFGVYVGGKVVEEPVWKAKKKKKEISVRQTKEDRELWSAHRRSGLMGRSGLGGHASPCAGCAGW